VVGHELTHGVTQFSSGLQYQEEAGAVNEALSDIFGACVDRQQGADKINTFLVGEAVYTPSIPGDAFRYMSNPGFNGNYDYYPTRYQGANDYGGVHTNSGIANLAFSLMVLGGKHPQGKTTVVVPAMDADFDKSLLAAAKVFYMANTACLTPSSGFFEIRECTMLHAGTYSASVEAAWEAVGVGPIPIDFGPPMTNLTVATAKSLRFVYKTVPAGSTVKCTTNGANGDADLYMSMISPSYSRSCRSESGTSNEACSVGPVVEPAKVYVQVYSYASFTGLTLACTLSPTRAPTKAPTKAPTSAPSKSPSTAPSHSPSKAPTSTNLNAVTKAPTKRPTKAPTKKPTKSPIKRPTKSPTKKPTLKPQAPPFDVSSCFQAVFPSCSCNRKNACRTMLSNACRAKYTSAGFVPATYAGKANTYIQSHCP
jgi:hypothetical protein